MAECRALSRKNGKPCGRGQGSQLCEEHRGIACYCCGVLDDPNGTGPAINTGFCDECNVAGCPEMQIGDKCGVDAAARR